MGTDFSQDGAPVAQRNGLLRSQVGRPSRRLRSGLATAVENKDCARWGSRAVRGWRTAEIGYRVDELVIDGIQVLNVGIQAGVVEHEVMGVHLDALHRGSPGVLGRENHRAGAVEADVRDLLITVLPQKSFGVQLQAMPEQTAFRPYGVRCQVLGLVGGIVMREEEAASLEARLDCRVEKRVRGNVPIHTRAPGRLAPAMAGVERDGGNRYR